MKHLIILLICCLALQAHTTKQAENGIIHVLIFVEGNPREPIYGSCQRDAKLMTAMLQGASDATGMAIQRYASTYDKTTLDREITNLHCGSNDIVVFYYSGHGYNIGNSEFPCLNFDESSANSNHQNLEGIHNRLKQKGARLTVTIGDLCNNIYQTSSGLFPLAEPAVLRANYMRLFTMSSGDILATSSKKGQTSGVYNNGGGSFFTVSLYQSFFQELGQAGATWGSIFNNARSKTFNQSSGQSPYFNCNVRFNTSQHNTGPKN